MTNSSRTDADAFLRRFRRGLALLPADIRDDLVDEVRSHIEDRLAQGKLDLTGSFGSPEVYASRFIAEQALSAAASQGRPFQLVAVLLAKLRPAALVVFVVLPLVVVEIMALVLAALGVLKPFDGEHIGLFLTDNGGIGALGWISDTASMHEVLGYSAMPLFVFCGLLLFWMSNRLLVSVARRQIARLQRDPTVSTLGSTGRD
jgi:uncharacterized membrane protein